MADETLIKKRITTYTKTVSKTNLTNSDVMFVDNPTEGTRKMYPKAIIDNTITSSGIHVKADNYSSIITDVNNQPVNTIYLYNYGLKSKIANLPSDKSVSILHYSHNYSENTSVGQVMIAIERGNDEAANEHYMYFRTTSGADAVWSNWTKVANNADVETIREAINYVKSDLNSVTNGEEKKYSTGYIDCAKTTIDINTVVENLYYKHFVDACVEGDVYLINGTGSSGAKPWTFVDASGKRLAFYQSVDGGWACDNQIIIAPANSAYIISNYHINSSTHPFAYKFFDDVHGQALRLSNNNAIHIAENSNFDNYITEGNYKVTSASVASTISNIPESVGGRLVVLTLANSDSVHQLYISTNGNWYTREKMSNGWLAWKTVASSSYVDTNISALGVPIPTMTNGLLQIPSNSDLNDYKTSGSYIIFTSAIAKTIANIPEQYSGRLIVMATSASGIVAQLFVTNTNRIYTRNYNGSWTSWSNANGGLTASAEYAEIIQENSDLNNYKTAGNYRVTSMSVANTIANIPEKNGGRLSVLTLASTGFVHQWYISGNNNWFTRELISGEWSKWKHLVDYDSMESYIGTAGTGGVASKGAYNALQAIIKNSQYDIAFANAFAPLPMKNYLGNTQNVHPKVLYFENGFGGHNFWMAYTPYPYSRDGYENPCVAYSDDGITWTNIAGNPLDDPNGYGYNSDTHLVYRESDSTLECWYRYVGDASQSPREETIYRQTTTDGVTWSAKEVVYSNTSGHYAYLLSPAIIIENNKYCIWVVNGDSGASIDYYEAPLSTPSSWSKIRSINFTITDDGISVKPWHIDLIKDGNSYALLLMCRNGLGIENNRCSLFISTSSDNVTYSTPTKVVAGTDNWDKYMYRSSVVKVGSKYRIYYSASGGGTSSIYNNAVWGIGITESDMLTSGYVGKYV